MTVTIGGIDIGGDNPCRFVAELGNAHNQSLARCLSLITAAKDVGCDLVKLQCYTPDELIALRGDGTPPEPWAHMTMRELYSRAQTPHDWFPAIAEYCRDLEIPWFSSVFGAESLALLESLGCVAYKIARLDNKSVSLIDAVALTGKPFLVSSDDQNDTVRYNAYPHPDPAYKAKQIAWSSANGGAGVWGIRLGGGNELYCPPGYPQTQFDFVRGHAGTDYDDCGYDGTFGENALGFSYHGTDPLPCIVAATLGAKLIEAHFHLRDEPSEIEANVSLDEYQFAEMVAQVRRVEGMMA